MTDEQIVKALECCMTESGNDCDNCSYSDVTYKQGEGGCCNKLIRDTLDLINRQKEEIERKTKLIAEVVDEYARFKEAAKRQEAAKVRTVERAEDEEIKRLRAEIAELKSELTITNNNFENAQKLYDESVKIGQKMNQKLMDAYKKLQTAKSEAIKEFAERLNKHSVYVDDYDCFMVSAESIDNLVKEMTEPVKIEHNSLCETETYKGE